MTAITPEKQRPRLALVVTSVVVAVLAFGAAAVGGVALWADSQKDEHGYLSTDEHPFAAGTRAIVSESVDLDLAEAGWLLDEDQFGKVRLEVEGTSSKPVFVGVARTDDVRVYRRGAAHSRVTDIQDHPFAATYEQRAGSRRPAPPSEEFIWDASASGRGLQELTWKVREGEWSVVVMNADGSRGVRAEVAAGARLPWMDDLGWAALGGAAVMWTGAALLLIAAFRPPRPPLPESPVRPAAPAAA